MLNRAPESTLWFLGIATLAVVANLTLTRRDVTERRAGAPDGAHERARPGLSTSRAAAAESD